MLCKPLACVPAKPLAVSLRLFYPAFQYWYALNNSKASINGLETRLSINQSLTSNIGFKYTLGYTYLRIDATYDKTAKYAMLQPKHLVNGDITMTIGTLTWSINGLYKVRNSIHDTNLNIDLKKSYTVWNTNADVAVYKQKVFVTLAVSNVFNTNYSDFIGAEMPGRWISGGLKMRL